MVWFHFNLKPYETFLNHIIIINILKKKITVDFLTKKMKVNEGEVPQYYVENSHQRSSSLASGIWCRRKWHEEKP